MDTPALQPPSPTADAGTTLTRAGCMLGAKMMLPLLPGVIAFSLAFGAIAAKQGLTLFEAALMSALVYAGASQLVALELWSPVWTWSGVLAVALVTLTVNMRMILMSAAFRPWFEPLGPAANYGQLFFLTDANFLAAARYRADGGTDVGVVLGAGVMLWVIWASMTVPGYLLGAMIAEPKRLGLDLFLPIFFSAMLVPLWRGRRSAIIFAAAAATAVGISLLGSGYWFIFAGAVAGAFAGALLDD